MCGDPLKESGSHPGKRQPQLIEIEIIMRRRRWVEKNE